MFKTMSYTVEKEWAYKDFCLVVIANRDIGCRCGYLGVPKVHFLFGKGYGEHCPQLELLVSRGGPAGNRGILSLVTWNGKEASPEIAFNVHGSLTYSGSSGYPIDRPNTWWFGFDCAHAGDAKDLSLIDDERVKEIYSRFGPDDGEIRTVEYCIKELESLADQIEIAKDQIPIWQVSSFTRDWEELSLRAFSRKYKVSHKDFDKSLDRWIGKQK